jgi:hypothetical protein
MLHPRPLYGHAGWVSGGAVGVPVSKAAIWVYLNQVPMPGRDGRRQAARDYFDRDLDTLGTREMLARRIDTGSQPSRPARGCRADQGPIAACRACVR